jgi:hypothetical protein
MVSPRTKSKFKVRPVVWFIIGFVVVAALLLAVLRFTPATNYDYNGYPIVKSVCPSTQRDCYFVQLRLRDNDYTISFYEHPSDVDNIPISPASVLSVYQFQAVRKGTVYIALPEQAPGAIGLAGTELSRILGTRFDIFNFEVKAALIGDDQNKVSCRNATATQLIIMFRQQENNSVSLIAPNCVAIGATDVESSISVADAYAYHLLKVIPTSFNTTKSPNSWNTTSPTNNLSNGTQ